MLQILLEMLQIRILWPGDPSLELLDGGAFAKWLKESAEQLADASYVSSNTQVPPQALSLVLCKLGICTFSTTLLSHKDDMAP